MQLTFRCQQPSLSVLCCCFKNLFKQKDLVNAIVAACNTAGGGAGEAPVSARSQKEFLRDLLLAQGIQKTTGSELDDLLARYVCMYAYDAGGRLRVRQKKRPERALVWRIGRQAAHTKPRREGEMEGGEERGRERDID